MRLRKTTSSNNTNILARIGMNNKKYKEQDF